ncbi:CsbD family protein [Corynebacterium sp.]|uniref:CsbD family protein n=1 Tax=Corynebacterium sp. TaxID=1720 RepID=UPI0027BACC07|nr:CsbD family protein [Corynebacterium sp.]
MADAESFLDKAKAKGKEIVGEVLDNDQMKNEGKGEAAAADAKGAVNDAKDSVEDKADDLKDKASETLGKLTDDK